MKVFQQVEHFRREFGIATKLNESFPEAFPAIYDKVLIHQRYHAFVTDFIPNTAECVRKKPEQSLRDIMEISIQICAKLRLMHSIGYIHNDIKPENILV